MVGEVPLGVILASLVVVAAAACATLWVVSRHARRQGRRVRDRDKVIIGLRRELEVARGGVAGVEPDDRPRSDLDKIIIELRRELELVRGEAAGVAPDDRWRADLLSAAPWAVSHPPTSTEQAFDALFEIAPALDEAFPSPLPRLASSPHARDVVRREGRVDRILQYQQDRREVSERSAQRERIRQVDEVIHPEQ